MGVGFEPLAALTVAAGLIRIWLLLSLLAQQPCRESIGK